MSLIYDVHCICGVFSMGDKKEILIVEDEMAFAKIVRMRLESVGYAVSVAGDAYTGTQKIIKGNPDLVILDLMMPAGGGFSLLERIRNIPAKASLPVIILTGKAITDELKEKAKSLDVSAIFSKPYETQEFVGKIMSLVPVV